MIAPISDNMRTDEIVARWRNIWNVLTYEIESARQTGIFEVDYWRISKADLDIGTLLLDYPIKTLAALRELLEEEIDDINVDIRISFNGRPIVLQKIYELRKNDLYKLCSIEGFVTHVTQVNEAIIEAFFQCNKCGAILKVPQMEIGDLAYPYECYEDQGGCGRRSSFKLLARESKYSDYQRLISQDSFLGQQVGIMEIRCFDSLTGYILPGETAVFHGILSLKKSKQNVRRMFLDCVGIEKKSGSSTLEMTDEEMGRAKALASRGDLWNILTSSFARSVYGHLLLKQLLLLQLFGGRWYSLEDGTTRRGSIHGLMVGDPGTVKSTLMDAVKVVAPRYTLASGREASKAGLTAGMTRDPMSEDAWILQAGALVLANGGICILDEFNRIPDDALGALHKPMEQGMVEVAKAGMNRVLPARTAILASMNPKEGRWTIGEKHDQINVDPALMSRFDFIVGIEDRPDTEADRAIAEYMGSAIRGELGEPPLSPSFLMKYINLASSIDPVLPKKVDDMLVDKYVEMREMAGTPDYPLHINPRQKDTIRRLVEASARARMDSTVREKDVEFTWNLLRYSLFTIDVMDMDAISTGITEQMRVIAQSLEVSGMLPAYEQDIFRAGYTQEQIKILLDKDILGEKDGKIYWRKR